MKWSLRNEEVNIDSVGIAKRLGVEPVVVRLMANRGLTDEDSMARFLFKDKSFIGYSYHLMKDMDKGIGVIYDAIRSGNHIRIIGDYDVDGVTSTYILYRGLNNVAEVVSENSSLDKAFIDYDIPHRIRDGYGMNVNLVEKASKAGVQTIITCDNGIAALEACRRARELGITVVVTDHHEPKSELPVASAVIDPHIQDDEYPFKSICGALVAYKFIEGIYEKSGVDRMKLMDLFVYAALGTVCDVMPLVDENRYVVKRGLITLRNQMRQEKGDTGLMALVRACELLPEDISVASFGFRIGPTINASGRLLSAKWAVKLLLTEDERRADRLASHLIKLNNLRKQMTEQATSQATDIARETEDNVLVVYIPGCHESIAGIVAGKIRETFSKPSLVITDAKKGGFLKGSARSIDAYNIFKELSNFEDILTHFGGHPKAAGFSLKRENLDTLREGLNLNCTLTADDLVEETLVDLVLKGTDISLNMISSMDTLAPFGEANESPVFYSAEMTLVSGRVVGKNHNFVQMNLMDSEGKTVRGVSFAASPADYFDKVRYPDGSKIYSDFEAERNVNIPVQVIYQAEINEFNGRRTVQLRIKEIESL